MRTAIFCPGPSLRWVSGYDMTIGVNRAPVILEARGHRVDGWAFLDWELFIRERLGYLPLACTSRDAEYSIRRHGGGAKLEPYTVTLCETFSPIMPDDVNWKLWTATVALAWAAWLKATSIDVYGADWTNQPDADGVSLMSNNRKPSRWAAEAQDWNHLSECLLGLGVKVQRVP